MSLRRWHQEKWVDIKTGKPCGRKSAKGSKRAYPACRPSKRVSSKTPKLNQRCLHRKSQSLQKQRQAVKESHIHIKEKKA